MLDSFIHGFMFTLGAICAMCALACVVTLVCLIIFGQVA